VGSKEGVPFAAGRGRGGNTWPIKAEDANKYIFPCGKKGEGEGRGMDCCHRFGVKIGKKGGLVCTRCVSGK